MGRKPKNKAADMVPLDTPDVVLDTAEAMMAELVAFCRLNDVTLVAAMSSYDRIVCKESRRYVSVGSTSARIGLMRLAEQEASLDASEEDDPDFGDDI